MTTEKLKNLIRSSLIGAVASGLLILSSYAQIISPVQDFFDKAFVPIQAAVTSSDSGIRQFFASITSIGSSRQEIRLLREEIVSLQAENSELSSIKEENEYLRGQTSVRDRIEIEYLTAEVVSFDRDVAGAGRLKISAGARDGVQSGVVVLAERGVLFGRVVSVGTYTSMVEIITDPSDKIPVKLEGKNIRGLFSGQVGEVFIVENVSRDAKTPVGERVVTSGEDGRYPAGLLVGTIKEVEVEPTSAFKTLVLSPLFELSEMEYVLVESR